MATFIARYYSLRLSVFNSILESTALQKLALSLGMAGVTGISAQIRIHLPGTPVPVTAQTLSVLLSGLILGGKWAGASQLIYVGLGAAGIGWFSGFSGGPAYLFGPTGGYLAGFIPAAVFIGHFSGTRPSARCFLRMLPLMIFANFVLIYAPGLLQLSLWMRLAGDSAMGFRGILSAGLFPFIAGDAVKILLAAGTAKALLPKESGAPPKSG